MFLSLNHQRLDVYRVAQSLVRESYRLTKPFPPDEKFALTSQIRRAAVSVLLNITEGCSRKSGAERVRFYEIARGSVVELDEAFGLAFELNYLANSNIQLLKDYVIRSYQLLNALIKATV